MTAAHSKTIAWGDPFYQVLYKEIVEEGLDQPRTEISIKCCRHPIPRLKSRGAVAAMTGPACRYLLLLTPHEYLLLQKLVIVVVHGAALNGLRHHHSRAQQCKVHGRTAVGRSTAF